MDAILNSALIKLLPVLGSILIIIAVPIIFYYRRRFQKIEFGGLELKLKEITEKLKVSEERRFAAAIEEKRKAFLNLPNVSFHYVDNERLTNFYNDYFREPTVDNMVQKIVKESSGDIRGTLPQIIEAKVGGKDLSEWIRTMKLPDTSLHGMFHRYQRETILQDQVTLGLELVDVELSEVNEFDVKVSEMKNKFEFEFDKNMVEKHKAILKEKAAKKTLNKLESASGWVLLEGSFLLSDEGDEFYKCSNSHPVNQYITSMDKQVTITVLIPKAKIESYVAGNYMKSVGKTINLRVYGEVWQPINLQRDMWDFQITPLAVY